MTTKIKTTNILSTTAELLQVGRLQIRFNNYCKATSNHNLATPMLKLHPSLDIVQYNAKLFVQDKVPGPPRINILSHP
jgi:hypothetical protein